MRVLLVASRLEPDFDADDVIHRAVTVVERVLPGATLDLAPITSPAELDLLTRARAATLVLVIDGGDVLDAHERSLLATLDDPAIHIITLLGPHFTPAEARPDPWAALAIPSGTSPLATRVALATELALRWWMLGEELATPAPATP